MEYFQYKGIVFSRDEHCPTCSQRKARETNSTATVSFGDRCNHRKTTRIGMHYGQSPTATMRQASTAEQIIINREFNL